MPIDRTCGGQFALIPAKVLYDDSLPATAKLLYGEIYRLSSAVGYCFATNREFTQILLCSENTVTNLINALKNAGHIRVRMIRRPGVSGGFQRRIFCGQDLAAEDPPDYLDGGTPKNCDPPKNLGGVLPKTCDSTIKKENKKNTPIAPDDVLKVLIPYVGDDADLWAALCGLLEVRKKKKKPLDTVRAATILVNRIQKLSGGNRENKIALLDNATEHKWDTVYPLKADELPAGATDRVVENEGVRYI